MTRDELRAYVGFMSQEDVQAYIKSGDLPLPCNGLSLLDKAAVWSQAAVDAALTRAAFKHAKGASLKSEIKKFR